MIYDCFLFFNELEILDLRLHELDPVVDKFVLVESPYTHSGKSKPLYYEKNKELFAEYSDKIIHIVAPDIYIPGEPIDRNRIVARHREATRLGLQNANPDDIILFSDVDEIPKAAGLKFLRHGLDNKTYRSIVDMFYYAVNCQMTDSLWAGTVIMPYGSIDSFQTLRDTRDAPGRTIIKGGWHFSYIGGPEDIIRKLESFADENLDCSGYKNPVWIAKCINTKHDIFNRQGRGFTILDPIVEPEYLAKNLGKFSRIIWREQQYDL